MVNDYEAGRIAAASVFMPDENTSPAERRLQALVYLEKRAGMGLALPEREDDFVEGFAERYGRPEGNVQF